MRKREGERERPNAKSKAENAHREDYYQPNKCVWVYILRLVSDQVNVQQNHLLCVPFFFSLAPNWSLYSATEFSLALVFAVPLIPSSLDIERKASPEKSLFHLLLIFIVFLRHTTSSHLCISPKKTHTHTRTFKWPPDVLFEMFCNGISRLCVPSHLRVRKAIWNKKRAKQFLSLSFGT